MLRKSLFRYRFAVIRILLSTFLSVIFVSLIPMTTKLLIDSYQDLTFQKVLWFSLLYVGSILLFLLFEYLKKISIVKFQRIFDIDMRHEIFAAATMMKHTRLNAMNDGDFTNSIMNDTDSVFENYVFCFVEMLISIISFVVYLSYMIYLSGFLSLIIILSCMFAILIPKLVGNRMSEKRKTESDQKGTLMNGIKDLLNQKDTFSHLTQKKYVSMFDVYNKQYEDSLTDLSSYQSLIQIVSGFSLYFINIVTFICGIFFVYFGLVPVSSLVAMIGYIDLVAVPVRDMIYQIITLRSSHKIVEKIHFYFENQEEAHPAVRDFQVLSIRNMSYDIGSFHLPPVSLSFEKGRKYAIVGENASGKSTLLKILANEIETKENSIFVDDQDITQIDVRQLIYYAGKPTVCKGSLLDNVDVFSTGTISPAVKQLTSAFKDRQFTFFGEDLSFGEKARISLARAMQAPQPVVILDEIFANVDTQNEIALTKQLMALDKTVILITHQRNDAYLKLFDHVYAMDEIINQTL